jgi:transcriptional regulator with XRE-family HTH domain
MRHREYVAEREARDPDYRAARQALQPVLQVRQALIGARLQAGLTQRELAERVGTTQSVIARMESGTVLPSLTTVQRLAAALGVEFVIGPDTLLGLLDAEARARRADEVASATGDGRLA